MSTQQQFPFDHDDRYRLLLRLFGVTPANAFVRLTDDELVVRFGFFGVTTPLSNVRDVTETGPYSAIKVIGPHLSLADRGATYGTSAAGGVCILFREPVKALPPLRNPGLTVTVADRRGLFEALQQQTGA
jgi:hypothetical protein